MIDANTILQQVKRDCERERECVCVDIPYESSVFTMRTKLALIVWVQNRVDGGSTKGLFFHLFFRERTARGRVHDVGNQLEK